MWFSTGRYRWSSSRAKPGKLDLPFGWRQLVMLRYVLPHPAVLASVGRINHHADDQPDYQANPGVERQESHQRERRDDAQDRHQRHQGSLEGPMQIGSAYSQ